MNATFVDVKFTLIMVALEGLLLTKRELNYLGKGLSEKVAFLIEKQSGEIIKEVYGNMKRCYSKRSNFVHQKKKLRKSYNITFYDLLFIRNIFLRCIEEILILMGNGTITEISSDGNKSDNKSLDDYIENLIFS